MDENKRNNINRNMNSDRNGKSTEKKPEKKPAKPGIFKKAFLIYVIVFAAVILLVDIFVWAKLSKFEKSNAGDNYAASTTIKVAKATEIPTPGSLVTGTAVTPAGEPAKPITEAPVPSEAPQAFRSVMIKAPEGYVVRAGEDEFTLTAEADGSNVDDSEFETVKTYMDTYSEYATIKTTLKFPKLVTMGLSVPENTAVKIVKKNDDGSETEMTPEVKTEGETEVYFCDYESDETNKDMLGEKSFEFLCHYSLFCAKDELPGYMDPYFPAYSEYLALIKRADNDWFMKHVGLPQFSDKTVKTYKGFSDELVYLDASMTQTLVSAYTGASMSSETKLGIWWTKMNGEWKICGLIY